MLAFGSQSQAASGAGEQAYVQLAFQTFDGGGDLTRQKISLQRRCGETAQRGAADE
ncbi:hypothetical protein D3C81_2050410 [compost metagenome]